MFKKGGREDAVLERRGGGGGGGGGGFEERKGRILNFVLVLRVLKANINLNVSQ